MNLRSSCTTTATISCYIQLFDQYAFTQLLQVWQDLQKVNPWRFLVQNFRKLDVFPVAMNSIKGR